jgi:HK97 family phage portal protein
LTLRQRIGGFLLRSAVGDPNNFLLNLINKTLTSSAQNVNDETALKVSAVYACVKVISEAIASLPLMIYKRKGDGKEVADNHYLYPILHDAPNEYQTSFEFRETILANLLLQGNSYCQKVEDGTGRIKELISFNPKNMEVEQTTAGINYKYTYEDQKDQNFPASKIWHVRNLPLSTTDNGNMPQGLVGLSPITLARENVGIAMAADEYAGRYFSNNATVGLMLKFPDGVKIAPDAKNYLNEKLASYSEGKNKFKSILLDQGGTLETIGMSNEDSQFLESRNFQVEDIARIFRVPPVLIGHPTNTMTYASAEQLFLSFATYTIRPWCVRLEQSMNRYLLNDRERGKYFFEFKMDGLLRGDLAGRYQAYSTARQWGWMNVDEIRGLENMNPIPDGTGKTYMQPMNMTKLGQEPQPAEPQKTQKEGDDNA